MGDEFTKNESRNDYMPLGLQMKAVIEVKFCNAPLQQDGFKKQVPWKLPELKCAVIPRLILSTGKAELAGVTGFPFFMCVSKTVSQRAHLGFRNTSILQQFGVHAGDWRNEANECDVIQAILV